MQLTNCPETVAGNFSGDHAELLCWLSLEIQFCRVIFLSVKSIGPDKECCYNIASERLKLKRIVFHKGGATLECILENLRFFFFFCSLCGGLDMAGIWWDRPPEQHKQVSCYIESLLFIQSLMPSAFCISLIHVNCSGVRQKSENREERKGREMGNETAQL